MRKRFLTPLLILFSISLGIAQKPVALQAIALFNGRQAESFEIFNPAGEAKEEYSQYVDNAYSLTIRPEVINMLHSKKSRNFCLISCEVIIDFLILRCIVQIFIIFVSLHTAYTL